MARSGENDASTGLEIAALVAAQLEVREAVHRLAGRQHLMVDAAGPRDLGRAIEEPDAAVTNRRAARAVDGEKAALVEQPVAGGGFQLAPDLVAADC